MNPSKSPLYGLSLKTDSVLPDNGRYPCTLLAFLVMGRTPTPEHITMRGEEKREGERKREGGEAGRERVYYHM